MGDFDSWYGIQLPYFMSLPLCQAVLRITQRDSVSPEDALRRLQSQWSNSKQVEHANVVLSTLWEPEVTRKQVRRVYHTHVHHIKVIFLIFLSLSAILKVLKAWNLVQKRIQQREEGRRKVSVTASSQL